jgi:hypothetical protein
MEHPILFEEQQRFKQWWLWITLILINGLFILAIYRQLFLNEPFGNNPLSNGGLLLVVGLTLLICLLFISFKLTTKITKEGIYVQFFPIHFKPQFYSFETMQKINTRNYSALMEYGGWGIRQGFFGKGKALTTGGNEGLQLELKNGKKLLIGTRKTDEINHILGKLNLVD